MTNIRWTDQTRNPIRAINRANDKRGWYCTKVSEGCQHCYAETLNHRFGNALPYRADVADDVEMFLDLAVLEKLIRQRKGKKTFLCDMTDLFHPLVSFQMLDKIFACMALCPQHTFQLLTKRPERALEYFNSRENGFVGGPDEKVWDFLNAIQGRSGLLFEHLRVAEWRLGLERDNEAFKKPELTYHGALPLPNVWVGVSCENQQRADERIPLLLQIPAAVRFLSCEPLLGEIDLSKYLHLEFYASEPFPPSAGTIGGKPMSAARLRGRVEWVICGGESGPGFRTMNLDWARSLRDQCVAANVAFFYKQDSAYHAERGQLLDGVRWEQFPRL